MTDLKRETWDRLQELFGAALERNADPRGAFVAEACGGDGDLQAKLEELLVAHQKAQQVPEFLTPDETSWSKLLEEVTEALPDAPVHSPKRIGRYHIKRVIASGGMGTVYEAVQEHPRRTVALKMMKQGIASRSALRRFEYESQILARLRHPGIAQVYEAGTHQLEPIAPEPGRDREGVDFAGTVPYFAMEYIPNAKPINNYAEEKKLGMRERLALFAQVCDAVHHGHQKGIIHRDLKPGNILVDSQGQPKVIDFGVARCTDSDMAVTTLQTDVGQLIGTLQYMSPEQCEADPHDIDTRSDVYALGVVLYDLLCGKLPYDVTRVAMYEATRVIREQQPTKMTTIDKGLKGDVETIVFKTLEKDRERRYQSADELRRDIEHYLKGELISARPPSVAYQLKILARRNKALAGGVAVAFVALTVGVIGTSIGLLKAREARNGAEQVTAFLEDMIAFADPHETKHPNLTMREALDRAAKTIGDQFKDRPLIEAKLRHTIGKTYSGLGMHADAELHLQSALQIRRRVLGDEHPDTLESMNYLGFALGGLGLNTEKEELWRDTVEIRRRVLGEEHPDTLDSMDNLGIALRDLGKDAEAETLIRRTLGMRRRVLGDEANGTLWSMNNLGFVLFKQGKNAEAETTHRQTLEIRRRVFGDEHSGTLWSMGNLGVALWGQGKYAEAGTIWRQTLESRRRVLGDEHPDTLQSMHQVALALGGQGKYAEAETLYRQTLEIKRRVLGNEHRDTVQCLTDLAFLFEGQDKHVEAEKLHRQTLEIRRRVLGDEHPDTLWSMHTLGFGLWKQGKYTEADTLNRRTLEIRRRVLGNEHPDTLWSMHNVALALGGQGEYAEAETLHRRTLEIRRRVMGSEHHDTLWSIKGLAHTLRAQGKLDEARQHVAELIACRKRVAETSHASPGALSAYAGLLLTCEPGDLRDPAAALPVAIKAVEMSDGKNPAILDTLALAQKMTGDLDRAIETLREGVALLPPGESSARRELEVRLVRFLSKKEDFAGVEQVYRDILLRRRANLPPGDPAIGKSLVGLGLTLVEQKKHAEAETLLRAALEGLRNTHGDEDPRTALGRSHLGDCLTGMGRYEEAERELLEAVRILDTDRKGRVRVRKAMERLAALYEAWDKPDKVTEWRARLSAADSPTVSEK